MMTPTPAFYIGPRCAGSAFQMAFFVSSIISSSKNCQGYAIPPRSLKSKRRFDPGDVNHGASFGGRGPPKANMSHFDTRRVLFVVGFCTGMKHVDDAIHLQLSSSNEAPLIANEPNGFVLPKIPIFRSAPIMQFREVCQHGWQVATRTPFFKDSHASTIPKPAPKVMKR